MFLYLSNTIPDEHPTILLLKHHAMPICVDCGVNFPLLKEDKVCKKCQMLEGKGSVAKIAIKVTKILLLPTQISWVDTLHRIRANVKLAH